MIGVGTPSRVARPRVSGAMRMRLGQSMLPMRMGSKRVGMVAPMGDGLLRRSAPRNDGRRMQHSSSLRAKLSNPLVPPIPSRAFAALLLGNVALAFGPWLVRLSDVGPSAAAFWRLALAPPFLLLLALGSA